MSQITGLKQHLTKVFIRMCVDGVMSLVTILNCPNSTLGLCRDTTTTVVAPQREKPRISPISKIDTLFVIDDHLFTFTVMPDSSRLLFLIDTGIVQSAVSTKAADKLKVLGGKVISGTSNTSVAPDGLQSNATLIRVPRVKVGDHFIDNLKLAVSESVLNTFAFQCDGVLGIDFLEKYPYVVNVGNSSLNFIGHSSHKSKLPFKNPKSLNIRFSGNRLVLSMKVESSAPVRFYFDCGIPLTLLRQADLTPLKLVQRENFGLRSLTSTDPVYRTDFVKIKDSSGVIVNLAPLVSGEMKDVNASLLGLDAIKGGAFFIDFDNGHLIIDELPNILFGGAEIICFPHSRYFVRTITPASKMATLGLKVGDEIMKIDGKMVSQSNFDEPFLKFAKGLSQSLAISLLHPGDTQLTEVTVQR